MSDLIERVMAAKAAAEVENPITPGGDWTPSQKAAILIAQVQAIVGGDEPDASDEPEPESEPKPEPEPDKPSEQNTGL